MKHTPGPWHLAADADGTMTTNDQGAQITMWPPQGGTVEQCANARLIAAAPDLLAALQTFANLDRSTPSGLWSIRPELCEAARAAIAQATGE